MDAKLVVIDNILWLEETKKLLAQLACGHTLMIFPS